MKKKLLILIVCLLVVPPATYSYYNYALGLANSSDETVVDFIVEPGQGVEEIAKKLEGAGLIRSGALFKLYASLSNLSSKLQAGEYQVPQNLNVKEVAELLQHGTFEEKLTFIEGWRREEYADALNPKSQIPNPKLNGAEFLRETEGLEGYLFPDTYFISTETTAEDLVKMMRENFDSKLQEKGAGVKGFSFEEVVIIASIVEREGAAVEDKPIVAGVLFNRLLAGMALQVDATVQYALGYQEEDWWKKRLTEDDLKIDSPYNTYKNPGLPPAPICNPGLDSLGATLNPVETEYWYYVSDSDGRMHFAGTIEEHNENVAKYVR